MRVLVVAFLGLLALGAEVQPAPLVDFARRSDAFDWFGDQFTLGYQFRVVNAVQVSAVGLFDFDADGLSGTHEVGLWRDDGTLILDTTIGPAALAAQPSASGLGNWVFRPVSPFTLEPGIYRVAARYRFDDLVVWQAGGIGTLAGVEYLSLAWNTWGVYGFPELGIGLGTDRYFGPNLDAEPIPEPASLLLLGAGVAGLVAARRRRRG